MLAAPLDQIELLLQTVLLPLFQMARHRPTLNQPLELLKVLCQNVPKPRRRKHQGSKRAVASTQHKTR
jgi:hypothetical protein